MAGGVDKYRAGIRYQIRGLWSGALDRDQFENGMAVLINDGLAAAFEEGARSVGLEPEEFTDVEQRAINDAADSEVEHLGDLADAIEAGSKANGGKLDPLLTRADTWALRYMELVTLGKVMAGKDQKFEWELGPTEHCPTCASLAGLVHRGSQWRNYVLPQNPPNKQLCCGGWRCQCKLKPTTKRASRRYPPVPGSCKE